MEINYLMLKSFLNFTMRGRVMFKNERYFGKFEA